MEPWQAIVLALIVGLLGFIAGSVQGNSSPQLVARASNADGPASLGALYVVRPDGDVYGVVRGGIYRIGNLTEDAQALPQ